MLLVNLEEHRIVPDEEIKHMLATRQPYGEWLKQNQITLDAAAGAAARLRLRSEDDAARGSGLSDTREEDLRMLLAPMATNGEEPVGSMGVGYAAGVPVGPAAAAVQLLQADCSRR